MIIAILNIKMLYVGEKKEKVQFNMRFSVLLLMILFCLRDLGVYKICNIYIFDFSIKPDFIPYSKLNVNQVSFYLLDRIMSNSHSFHVNRLHCGISRGCWSEDL